MNTPANADLLTTTIHALESGLTAVPLSQVMDTTEAWQQQFLQSGIPALQDVAREIGQLQSLLTSQPMDGAAIGRCMGMMGAQLSGLLPQTPEDRKVGLSRLSTLLLRLGGELETDNNGQ